MSILDYKITQLACKANRCKSGRLPCPCPEMCADGEGVSVRALVWGFIGSALISAGCAGCIVLMGGM